MSQREVEIRRIAYSIWEREGRPTGRETAHWLEAEKVWEEALRRAAPARAIASRGPQTKPTSKARKSR